MAKGGGLSPFIPPSAPLFYMVNNLFHSTIEMKMYFWQCHSSLSLQKRCKTLFAQLYCRNSKTITSFTKQSIGTEMNGRLVASSQLCLM